MSGTMLAVAIEKSKSEVSVSSLCYCLIGFSFLRVFYFVSKIMEIEKARTGGWKERDMESITCSPALVLLPSF